MSASATTSTFHTAAGDIPAYVAMPSQTPAPAILMVASIFGVDDDVRAYADRYAERGFIAIAHDPFWRTAPGVRRPTDEKEMAEARARNAAFVMEDGVADLAAIVAELKTMPAYNGKFAVVGYCFGGRYAFLAAARLHADAAVAFHGVQIGKHLDEIDSIACPVSFHFGDADTAVPMTEVDAIAAAFAGRDDADIGVYAGVHHGFTAPSRPSYDADATRTSDERSMAILERLK